MCFVDAIQPFCIISHPNDHLSNSIFILFDFFFWHVKCKYISSLKLFNVTMDAKCLSLIFDCHVPLRYRQQRGSRYVAPWKTEKELLLNAKCCSNIFLSGDIVSHIVCGWTLNKKTEWNVELLFSLFTFPLIFFFLSCILHFFANNLLHFFPPFGRFAFDFHIQQLLLLLFVSDHNSMWNIDFSHFRNHKNKNNTSERITRKFATK